MFCKYCSNDLGRQLATGSHYNCRTIIGNAMVRLGWNLRDAGVCEAAFRKGYDDARK